MYRGRGGLRTLPKTVPNSYKTVTLGLFQSNISHTCTKFCVYLTNLFFISTANNRSRFSNAEVHKNMQVQYYMQLGWTNTILSLLTHAMEDLVQTYCRALNKQWQTGSDSQGSSILDWLSEFQDFHKVIQCHSQDSSKVFGTNSSFL